MATNIIVGVVLLALFVMWLRWGGVWDYVLRWLHVLWACRVSVVSVVFGYLMMAKVPQAQDVFADTSVGPAFWILFFVFAFLLWALPVHYAARRMLDREEWALPDRLQGPARLAEQVRLINAYATPVMWVPRILGIACFGAILVGMFLARENLAPAARMELAASARHQIMWLMAANLVVAGVFAWFIIQRATMMRHVGIKRAGQRLHAPGLRPGAIGISESGPLWLEQLFSPAYWRARAAGPTSQFYADLFATSAVIIISGLFVLVFVDPLLAAGRVPRALFLIFMLGASVVGLTWVAAWSHKLRAPLLLIFALTLALIATFSPRFHDVRQIPLTSADKAAQTADRQVTFAAAISRWMDANECNAQRPDACPSPIIVAGQGGASRAAFFSASVIGDLLRTTRSETGYRDFGRQLFALSTVSGSSLAAIVTRATLEDTVDPGKGDVAWRDGPCGAAPDGVYFRSPRASAAARGEPPEFRQNWRACLQKLTAGDFLSPVFVGIAIRDLTSVPRWFRESEPWWQDRAVLLERAWERRYAAIVTDNKDAPGSARHPAGLQRRFGYLMAEGGVAARPGSWIPLLFVNGSSVETGRRILSSDVKPWQCRTYPDGKRGVSSHLEEAYDLFEIVGSGRDAPKQAQEPCAEPKLASSEGLVPGPPVTPADQAADFRLSTIGTMSARFPIISPPGALRNQDGDTVDRIVDGGFFENDGLVTAGDIARVLIDEYRLRPVILHVTNEPLAARDSDWRDPRPEPSPTLPDAKELTWIQSVSMPLKGLYQTRSGHGNEAANVAVRLVEDHARSTFCNGVKDCAVPAHYIRVAVYDSLLEDKDSPTKLPEVSMSWWLSQPVQAYLDAQLAHPRNRCSLALMQWHLIKGDAAPNRAFSEPQACTPAASRT